MPLECRGCSRQVAQRLAQRRLKASGAAPCDRRPLTPPDTLTRCRRPLVGCSAEGDAAGARLGPLPGSPEPEKLAGVLEEHVVASTRRAAVACVFTGLGEDVDVPRDELKAVEGAAEELLHALATRAAAGCEAAAVMVGDGSARSASMEGLLPLARLAAWTHERWVRKPTEWEPTEPCDGGEWTARAASEALAAHLLEEWDAPPALRTAVWFAGEVNDNTAVACTEEDNRVARAFCHVYADCATGAQGARASLREHVAPSVSKKDAASFVALDKAQLSKNPLKSLRIAQCQAAGGQLWATEAACEAALASRLGRDAAEEEFYGEALKWAMGRQEELRTLESEEPRAVSDSLDYLCAMWELSRKGAAVDIDEEGDAAGAGTFSCAGRTPKRVLAAAAEFNASRVTFEQEDDELFERNPRGISGFYRAKARIPHGTEVEVPYTYGPETLGIPGQPGFEPCQIKVEEILSLRRLIHEGKQLGNCLEDRYQSQVKYILRARQRSSSYWSMTAVRPNGDVDFLGLIEVWHVGGNRNIVHQFEGPRPRTLPLAEGWWWLQGWCEQEDIDWTTWNCYS